MVYKDKRSDNVEYLELKVPKISFTDLKPYLTNKVIPEAIIAYAKTCTGKENTNEYASGSVLYNICEFSQNLISKGVRKLREVLSMSELRDGYTDSCESIEKTIRIWEDAKIKMLDEKYFEEVIVDGINSIKSGKAKIKMSRLKPEVRDAAERIIMEITYEINNSHFFPRTDPLGRLRRGEKK